MSLKKPLFRENIPEEGQIQSRPLWPNKIMRRPAGRRVCVCGRRVCVCASLGSICVVSGTGGNDFWHFRAPRLKSLHVPFWPRKYTYGIDCSQNVFIYMCVCMYMYVCIVHTHTHTHTLYVYIICTASLAAVGSWP